MRIRLTPKQSRTLAASLLAFVVVAVVAAVALPVWLLHKRYDGYIDDYSDRLKRYRRVAAMRPAIEASIKEVEGRNSRQYYLKGGSATLAAAELQGLVTRIIETNKGKISSSQAVPAPTGGKEEGKPAALQKATISIQLNASILQLLMIMHALETSRPYVFVDQLTVRAGQSRLYKPVPGIEPEYAIQLTVSGYAAAGAVKP